MGIDLIYALANISALTETYWFIGLPFNDTSNPRLEIGDASEAILGKYLLGFQLGNEPDLYANVSSPLPLASCSCYDVLMFLFYNKIKHGLRSPDYNTTDYVSDIQTMLNAIGSDSGMPNKTNLMGPSICCEWTTQEIFDAGFSTLFDSSFSWFAAEQ